MCVEQAYSELIHTYMKTFPYIYIYIYIYIHIYIWEIHRTTRTRYQLDL